MPNSYCNFNRVRSQLLVVTGYHISVYLIHLFTLRYVVDRPFDNQNIWSSQGRFAFALKVTSSRFSSWCRLVS